MNQLVFGGGAAETILNPIVLVALLLGIVLILSLPRRHAIAPFLMVIFLVPLGQVVVAGGFHFTVMRIIILAGCARWAWMSMQSPRTARIELNRIDMLFLYWALCRSLVFILLWQRQDAFINQLGFLIDGLGGYFALRALIRDESDIAFTIQVFTVLAMIIAASMLYEKIHLLNAFGTLGGVRMTPEIREGRVRCQGVFQHSIVAGVFGGTLVPMFVWLYRRGRSRTLGVLGIVASACIVLTSASSTPVLAMLAGLLGLCCWPIRAQMRTVRIAIVIAISGLALVMKAPVWFIIAHIDVVGSSSGYHRAMLVDQFIRNFPDWWMLGVKDTGNWGFDLWDVQNQFVAEGEIGGLVTFLLFVMIVVHCFRIVGQSRRSVRAVRSREEFIWTLGAVLFAHTAAFFGSNYFDQVKIWWYATIVMISACASLRTDCAEQSTLDFPLEASNSKGRSPGSAGVAVEL